MPEGNCTDASFAWRPIDNLSYRSSLPIREAACFCKSQRAECKRNESSQSGTLFPWITALKIPDDKARVPKQPNKVFSTEVETWKYHEKSVRCPDCGVKEVPIIVKQQKFTTSRLAAFCLLGCWPFCFIPLLMSRDKNVRTLCPRCGYDYGVRNNKLVCSPKCAFSCGGQSDSAISRTHHLWTDGPRIKSRYCDRETLSMSDETMRALRVAEKRSQRGSEGDGCHCRRSQSKLSREYAFCTNQVTNRSSPYDECSRNDYAHEKRDHRCDLGERKAQERSESENDNRMMFDFYSRQACYRECG
ncbi:uncharacterized protein LOC126848764 isoform X1 [Cataglyphis hispanica]|uniref:uncharacterized protein LOC126848764 isoform X1 n=1 Tax=Cataglyphis hispanica TaxID=1086592 RepID=UPI00217F238A|nr:uncharacterized protein LOC126848764 isoform X1 [Cataglyphis hispanica]